MKKQGISRRLGFESLEQRAMLAGNVTASVVDNVLVITGDDASNFIEIRQLPGSGATPWEGARYEVVNPYVPKRDTPTLINGQSSVIMEGIKNGFSVKMNGGNDLIYMYRPRAAGNIANAPGIVDFDMGSGNDAVFLYITNHQQVNVALGTGADRTSGTGADRTAIIGKVSELNVVGDPAWQAGDPPGDDFINVEGTATGPVSIYAGYGNNVIRVANLKTITSRATVNITSGSGNDDVTLSGLTLSAPLQITSGNGNDNVTLRGLTLSAPLRIDTGGGRDSVGLFQIESASNLVVNSGKGDDIVVFSNLSIAGTLSAWLGEGDDWLESAGTNRADKVVFRGWDGIDTLYLHGNDTFDSEDISGFETIR